MYSLASLDPLISERSLLKHPFYVKWSRGELSLDDLRVYAKEYYHLVQRIPGIVSRVRDRAVSPVLQSRIDVNVQEETEHIDLWERFVLSLGISREELANFEPSQKVKDAVRTLEGLCSRSLEEGMACMYSLERELPMIAQTKKQGLLEFYGLSSADAHVYFDEHLLEEKHIGVWLSQPNSEAVAVPAAQASLRAQNQVLDAVCDACGISMDCSSCG